jgi:hypothetical protein
VVEGNEIPYQPWAAAKQKENYENWLSRDPEVKCYLPGVPRATYMPYPFQILQTANNDILMAYEYASASRVIKMGKVEPPPVDTWMGQSAGRWERDTLVVDVTGLNDQTWFDKGAQLLEFKCVEFVEELMYGDLRKKTGKEPPFTAARLRWP